MTSLEWLTMLPKQYTASACAPAAHTHQIMSHRPWPREVLTTSCSLQHVEWLARPCHAGHRTPTSSSGEVYLVVCSCTLLCKPCAITCTSTFSSASLSKSAAGGRGQEGVAAGLGLGRG